MTKKEGQVVLLSDANYLDNIRKIRLDIDHEIREVLEEYKDLELEIKEGGIKELGNAKKGYLTMLLNIKKARVDAIAKQIMNAKDSNEINLIIKGFEEEINNLKEAMNNESRQRISRPKTKSPYSSSRED